jgi:hypothetical protein
MQERTNHKAILEPKETKAPERVLFSYYYPDLGEYIDAESQVEADKIHDQKIMK